MANKLSTLMDILTPQQFRIVILLGLGLDDEQIATFLEISQHDYARYLLELYGRLGCFSRNDLAARLLFELDQELYDRVQLKKQLAGVTARAKQMFIACSEAASFDA